MAAIELQETSRSSSINLFSGSVENSINSPCEILSKKKRHLICMAILVVAAIVAAITAYQLVMSGTDLKKDKGRDQGWSVWSSWSTCSKSCGEGFYISTRTCMPTDTTLSGRSCIGPENKTQVCTLRSCPEWSGWSSWTSCNTSCGDGQQKSTRTCDSTDTTLSVIKCNGSDTKSQVCKLRSCPVWNGSSSWSSCSSSCGVGHQKSTRICTLPSCTDAKDCLEVLNQNKTSVNGVYNVQSPSSGLVYPVYCDMTTDEGGWTVFQKRFNGSLDFYRTFKEYEDGFGDVNAEFWMGLKHVYDMTSTHTTELRIDLTAADSSTAYVTYQNFYLSPGPDYRLHIGQVAGTAVGKYGDWRGLTSNNGNRFSTKDKDMDGSYRDCAELEHGGWWYRDCTWVNLNGDYATPGTKSSYRGGAGGVIYYSFKHWQSLKTTTIMFRRK